MATKKSNPKGVRWGSKITIHIPPTNTTYEKTHIYYTKSEEAAKLIKFILKQHEKLQSWTVTIENFYKPEK